MRSPIIAMCWLAAVGVALVGGCDASRPRGGGSSGGDAIDAMRRKGDVGGLAKICAGKSTQDATRAVAALGDIGTPAAAAAILAASFDPRAGVRAQAVISLGVASRRGHVDRIAEMLKQDADPLVRAAAARALGQVYACGQMPDLIDAYETDRGPAVGKTAEWAIVRIIGMRHTVGGDMPADAARKESARVYREIWKANGETMTQQHWEANKR